ncbi:MAG: serine hydroxymethyltransferase [Firmicutes bacterium]|nr:serine hydroxymethyltransferase [Bacillota bacterium]
MSTILNLIKQEEKRQNSKVNLIASENIASKAVLEASGSMFTNKYAEGYPGKRYYGGCEIVDIAENHARDLAKKIFRAEHANVQPHSGSNANMGVYMAVLNVGDTVLAMSLDAGGHLTHGAGVSFSGKLYNFVHYGIDENGVLDYAGLERLAREHKPKLIVAGGSAYSLVIDFERIAKTAKEVGAMFMVDMAHIAGPIAVGLHPNPFDFGADFVTTTTHKTLRGPRGGMILCKEQYAKAVDSAIFPRTQGGPLMNIVLAKAVCFEEALTPEYKVYMQKVLDNTKYLAEQLVKRGIKIVSGRTENHLFLIDLTGNTKSGKQVQEELELHNIVVNKNKIQGDTRSAAETSGIRIGLPFITNFKGVDNAALDELADIIAAVILDKEVPKMKILNKIFK